MSLRTVMLLSVCVALSSSSAAFAAETQYRPQPIQLTLPADVLAELRDTGGFIPREIPPLRGVRILRDGSIVAFEGRTEDGIRATEKLGNIAPEKLALLIQEVDRDVPATPLTQQNPEAGICADAPIVTYAIRKTGGQTIMIHEKVDCVKFEQAGVYSTQRVLALLDAFQSLAYLKR
jgi:hypothetical protein